MHGREEPCQLGPTVSQLGQQGRLIGGRQGQMRVQMISQDHGDEAGPRSSWEINPQLRVRHSPVILGQVHGNEAGSRSGWEVSPRVMDR